MNKKPIIGISTNYLKIMDPPFTDHKRIYVNSGYVESIVEAGGAPLLLPVNADRESTDRLLEMVDGVVLSGGQDVHPSYYQEEEHPLLGATARDRDDYEMHLIKRCREKHIPILGICRGLQIINVAFGGTLFQDLSQHSSGKELHQASAAHAVALTPQSRLHRIFGTSSVTANSYHHQAIKDLAAGLTVSAISHDGVIEGIEAQSAWILAVQWHPEVMINSQPEMKKLFEALISEANRQRSVRS